MSQQQSGGQNHNIKITNESFEIVTGFTYLGVIPVNTCFYGGHPDLWNVKDKSGLWFDTAVLLSTEISVYWVEWMTCFGLFTSGCMVTWIWLFPDHTTVWMRWPLKVLCSFYMLGFRHEWKVEIHVTRTNWEMYTQRNSCCVRVSFCVVQCGTVWLNGTSVLVIKCVFCFCLQLNVHSNTFSLRFKRRGQLVVGGGSVWVMSVCINEFLFITFYYRYWMWGVCCCLYVTSVTVHEILVLGIMSDR